MKLFACICNQPQRLAPALAPVRAALIAQPPVSRWGLGYMQGGDALLVRTPKASPAPVDLAAPLIAEIKTDCAIAQAVRDGDVALGGTDNTPPFRFRRWMYAHSGLPAGLLADEVAPRLLAHVPDYLRRNLRGRTPAELTFHLFLATMHDAGHLDDPNLAPATTARMLAATLRLVGAELARAGRPPRVAGSVAVTNGRSMIVAHLGAPLRLRRLWVNNDRGERDPAFRGFLVVGGDAEDGRDAFKDGFEDVPAHHAVLISRDLQASIAELAP